MTVLSDQKELGGEPHTVGKLRSSCFQIIKNIFWNCYLVRKKKEKRCDPWKFEGKNNRDFGVFLRYKKNEKVFSKFLALFSAKHQCAPLGTISGCLEHREVWCQDVWKPKFPRKSQNFRKILKFGRHEPSSIFRSGCEPSNIFRSYVLPAFQNTKERRQTPFLCIKRVPNVSLSNLENPGNFWNFQKFLKFQKS